MYIIDKSVRIYKAAIKTKGMEGMDANEDMMKIIL